MNLKLLDPSAPWGRYGPVSITNVAYYENVLQVTVELEPQGVDHPYDLTTDLQFYLAPDFAPPRAPLPSQQRVVCSVDAEDLEAVVKCAIAIVLQPGDIVDIQVTSSFNQVGVVKQYQVP